MRSMIFTLLLSFFSQGIYASDSITERKLKLIKEVYKLEPKNCDALQVKATSEEKIKSGEVFFMSKLFSGNNDTSCKTCHLDEFNITDGLALAVGVGGKGEGSDRLYEGSGTLVQRNAISLIGRGSKDFKNFFWDGKVDAGDAGEIYSQFGDLLSMKYESPLAVASSLPIIERDEFIGVRRPFLENDLQKEVGDTIYQKRYEAISSALRTRILSKDKDSKEVFNALKSAGLNPEEFELADLGNLISHFIASKFKCKPSKWDKFIEGDNKALTLSEKRGAILFFGKGRCAACHSGPMQSDFSFHSIGTPQGLFGPHARHRDLGRGAITLKQADLYKFRTPPLLDISKSPPYGHNGIFKTLKEVVTHHYNPIQFYVENPEIYKKTTYEVGKLNDTRDKVLSSINLRNDEDVNDLLKFLKTL